jgi:NCAIR mutase (PurE)-related protein
LLARLFLFLACYTGDMNSRQLKELAESLARGESSVEQFLAALQAAQRPTDKTATLADASLDLDRARRCGFPEVVFGEGKSVETLSRIFTRLHEAGVDVLATRITAEKAERLADAFPAARYNATARTWRWPLATASETLACGYVPIVTAGSSDLPVADEARETLAWMGVNSRLVQDVGVAGPHRLPERLAELADADAVIVVAGMEGALPSVVGGHVACPVIGVPTSVGYGANFGGLAALLSMLNSCAANVLVVNIDAGFKAAYVAGLIATRRDDAK